MNPMVSSRCRQVVGVVALVLAHAAGAGAALRAQDVVIAELMAVNDSTLTDEDGDTSDWLELHNAGEDTVDLVGWYLTDDPLELTKWRLPSVALPAGASLVVFASDKDRRRADGELHTNFKLASAGEYLALVAPDGVSVVWAYDPFPPQVRDTSYGLSQNASFERLVRAGDAGRARVPVSAAEFTEWRSVDYDDSSWTSGTTGAGYDRSSTYRDLIGLDLRSEMEDENTTAYLRVPFTIDDPTGLGGLELRMKYDDGFVAYLNGEEIARANAPTGLDWDSSATSLHDDGDAVVFEAFSVAAVPGLLRAGPNVLAVHGLNDNLGSSDFLVLPELDGFGSGDLDPETRLYFSQPTPGWGNPPGFDGVSATPELSHPGGLFGGTLEVLLVWEATEGVVRYTTDGSEPDESSPAAGSSILIDGSTLLRVKGFEPSLAPSPTVSAGYVRVGGDVVTFSSDLPVIVVDNFGAGGVPQNDFQPAWLALFEPGDGGRTRLTTEPTLESRIGIKVRGSSTSGRPKKSYSFEFWDEKNEDKDLEILGLPEESDWVLYGAYNFDRAHLRNPLMYELSNQVGRYATRTRFCEVYVNTGGGTLSSSDYHGVYSLMEKIKRGADRVDVERLTAGAETEPEITGGYMLKIDRLDPGDSGFSAAGRRIAHVYPKEEYITSLQADWIRDHFNAFYSALEGPSFRDPDVGYRAWIDVDSWIDHHILNVLAKNVDALRLSTYFFKRRGGKIEYGPIWDFDRSIDSTDGRDNDPRTWNGTGDGTDFFNYPWWDRLFDDPDFWQRYRDRWHELRAGPLHTSNVNSVVDGMSATIEEAQARDSDRWGQASPSVWRSDVSHVKSWLGQRSTWIDTQFPGPPRVVPLPGPIDPGAEVAVIVNSGTLYYTLDGSDPRAPGGAISPHAFQYDSPIVLETTARIVARARFSASSWSAPVAGTYYTSVPELVISELMYHPANPEPESSLDADDFEFVELLNRGATPIDLDGVRFTNGIRFEFPAGSEPLPSGEYVILVSNLDAFAERYDTSALRIDGEYEGRLENAGERLRLEGSLGEPILDFRYEDTWYPTTDGDGDSLVVIDPWEPLETWALETSWGPSTVIEGTPGAEDPGYSGVGGRQRVGDSNQDGVVDLSDAISLLLRLFADGGIPLPCEGASLEDGGNLTLLDVNADAGVDVSDAVHLLDYLFRSGPAPAAGERCIRIEGCPSVCVR